MGQRRQHGDIGAGLQRQVIGRLDVGRLHHLGPARIDHDQLRALPQPLLHARGEHGMRGGWVGADHDNHVGMLDRIEVLRASRGAVGLAEAVAGGRVADARAGVDIVVAEALPHQLLDEIGLLVGAARGGDAADRAAAILVLDAPELAGDMRQRLLPAHLVPRIGDLLAHHRRKYPVLVGGVAIGETALHAAVAMIGLAILVGHHADDFVIARGIGLDLGLEVAAHAAISAGGHHRTFRHSLFKHRFLAQRIGGAGLHAGAAGHAFGAEE